MQEGAETKMIVGVPSQTGVIYPVTIVCVQTEAVKMMKTSNSAYCTEYSSKSPQKFFEVSTES